MLELIRRLHELGIDVWVGEGKKLHYKAPHGSLSGELLAELRDHREQLISYLSIQRVSRNEELPLSYAQERLWFLDQLEPNSAGYNVSAAIRITGTVRVDVFEEAFTGLIERHENLRTVFQTKNGSPVQVIREPERFRIPVIDLRAAAEAEREERARRLAIEEATTPFNLSVGPLLRTRLIRLGDSDHVLVLNMHHIISDGWSMGVLIREIGEISNALQKGEEPQLTPLPIQYADFSVWQRGWMEAGELQNQLEYWKEQLEGAPALLNLPIDFPRPAIQRYAGAAITFTIPAGLTSKIRELSRSEGATLFMVLLSAFYVLLSKYTGEEDISVGSPIANRNRKETAGLIGFFVNTLVLRAKIQGDQTFGELLQEVKKLTLEAYDHQDLPFEKLVEVLQPTRDLSYGPLFQVMLLLNKTEEEIELGELKLFPQDIETGLSPFDLTLNLDEVNERIEGTLEYNTDIFRTDTVQRMMKHFVRILEVIADNNQIKISEAELLDEQENRTMLVQWNETKADFPEDRCIHQLFEKQVEKTPAHIAVVYEDQRLSYEELNRRANSLGHYLQKRGVGPDVRVGLSVERSLEMIIGLLGILKAGGAYVPLDPHYPPARLQGILDDTQVPVVLTQEKFKDLFPGNGQQLICLDSDWKRIGQESQENPDQKLTPQNLAYVIYTSGSTGKPNGAMIEHRPLVNCTVALMKEYSVAPDDRILQFASFSWDTAGEEIYPALTSGATLVLRTDEMLATFADFLRLCEEWQVTMLNLPTAFWQELIVAVSQEQLKFPPSVRHVVIGGERANPEHIALWQKLMGREPRLVNSFGTTEATAITTLCDLSKARIDPETTREISIGKPIANVQTYILDRNMKPVPVGVAGELVIGGAGLARGYLNNGEHSAEKFIPNPFGPEPGTCLYRTGDMARYFPDGNIGFMGRMDFQVKVRGIRVECGEIESMLVQHENIREVAVIARPVGDVSRLIAYVMQKDTGKELTTTELRDFLAKKIPEYMIPSVFVRLDAFPKTPSGKIDRRMLPEPEKGLGVADAYVVPRDDAERKLAEIWQEVLKVERVGIHDNFFDRGGHSLLATQVISRMREHFKVEISLKALFGSPTIEALAQAITRVSESGVSAIFPVSREGELPLSYAQERLWFLDQLEPEGIGYNETDAVRVTGTLRTDVLEEAFTRLMERHENVRTVFQNKDGKPVLIIKEPERCRIPVIDLSDVSEAEREVKARQLIGEEMRTPFHLSTGPLMRVKVIKLREDDHALVLSMHHIISDGWSMEVLIRETVEVINALLKNEEPQLPQLPVQYADYAVWQRRWLGGGELERQLKYWKEQLSGAPELLNLPTDYPRPATESYRGNHINIAISEELTSRLKKLSQDEGVTLFMTLLAAFNVLLYRYSGQEDICVGSPIANRNRKEIEGLIGFFVNTLVLRSQVNGEQSFKDFLGDVKKTTLEAYDHQDLPFEKLVEELHPHRQLSYSPLFQVMMVLQNTPGDEIVFGGMAISPFEMESGIAKFDLMLNMLEHRGRIECVMEYNTDLYRSDTIERMLLYYERVLNAVVDEAGRQIAEIELIDETERQRILMEWNDTEVEYPREKCFHQLFEEQVERTPENIAVVCEDQQLTYRELNERSNQLARYLQKRGVGPEGLVGICVERSLEMIVGILGILKAGGAYVPLDTNYPQERMKYMMADSGIDIVLTHARLLDRLGAAGGNKICLDADWVDISCEEASNVSSAAQPENLAYVIYTSGSTGKPKGVAIEHRNTMAFLTWVKGVYSDKELSHVLCSTSICFDLFVFEVFGPLSVGGKVIVVENLLQVPAMRNAQEILLINTVPSAMMELLRMGGVPNSARTVNLAGEPLKSVLVDDIYRLGHVKKVYDLYGPSEDTTYSTYMLREPGGVESIGRPVGNTRVYILDNEARPVPVGVVGEIYIGGEGQCRGYSRRPELTSEKFIPDPCGNTPGARLYRTGDLARYLPDGNIEFWGG